MKKAPLIIGIIIIIIGVIGLVVLLAGGSGAFSSGELRMVCDYELEIDPLGIGDPDFEKLSCQREECGLFSLSPDPLLFTNNGEVQLVIAGNVEDTDVWDSGFLGIDTTGTLKSTCKESPPTSAIVKIYDEEGFVLAREVTVG